MIEQDIPTLKRRLRRRLKERLRAIDASQARRAATAAGERFMALPEVRAAKGMLICLSFDTELDTWGLLDPLLVGGRDLYVPRAEKGEPQLHLHRYPCPLRALSFGLRQPLKSVPELDPRQIDQRIDLALVLGLAFDQRGYRLGYGGGYFDRFLAAHRIPAIALAYDLQLIESLPVESHDIPMTAVVTETRVVRAAQPDLVL